MMHYSFGAAVNDYTASTAGEVDACDGIAVCLDIKIGTKAGSKFKGFIFDSGEGAASQIAAVVTGFEIKKGIHPATLDAFMASDAASVLDDIIKDRVALKEVNVTATLKSWGKDAKFSETNRKLKKQYQNLSLTGTLVTTEKPTSLGKIEVTRGNFLYGYSMKIAPIPSSPVTVSVDGLLTGAPISFKWGVA